MLKPQKAILSALIGFVNSGELSVPVGPVFDTHGNIIAKFEFPNSTMDDWVLAQEESKKILNEIYQHGSDWGISYVNGKNARVRLWSENEISPCTPIPLIEHPTDLPIVALFLAYSTPTGVGDSLAHRITLCGWCRKFFLRKTKKSARFCQKTCRYAYYNSKKKPS
jgi:hypothetical protein